MINEQIYHRLLVTLVHLPRPQFYRTPIIAQSHLHRIVLLAKSINLTIEPAVHQFGFLRRHPMMMIRIMPMSMLHPDFRTPIPRVNFPINECLTIIKSPQIIARKTCESITINEEISLLRAVLILPALLLLLN